MVVDGCVPFIGQSDTRYIPSSQQSVIGLIFRSFWIKTRVVLALSRSECENVSAGQGVTFVGETQVLGIAPRIKLYRAD